MEALLIVALAGFAASFVDGALGMGFGPTSSTILLGAGLAPAAVSATVNLAKVAVGLAAGAAHWKFGNIDKRAAVRLALPGAVGAVLGVTVLANVDGDVLRPYLAVLLLGVGVRMLVRFSGLSATPSQVEGDEPVAASYRGIGVAGFLGGITNGLIGAWGPVVTPVMLHRRFEPRVAIGTVNTAEIAVALTASGSLLASLNGAGVEPRTVVAMLVGGVIAAPVAAWVVKWMKPRSLGIGAATMLLVTNSRELAKAWGVGSGRWVAYAAIAAAVGWALARPRLAARAQVAAAVGSPAVNPS